MPIAVLTGSRDQPVHLRIRQILPRPDLSVGPTAWGLAGNCPISVLGVTNASAVFPCVFKPLSVYLWPYGTEHNGLKGPSHRQNRDPGGQAQPASVALPAAMKLIENGVSRRQTAKLLGVHHSTVQADLADNPPKGGGKSATGSAKTKAHRATVVTLIEPVTVTALASFPLGIAASSALIGGPVSGSGPNGYNGDGPQITLVEPHPIARAARVTLRESPENPANPGSKQQPREVSVANSVGGIFEVDVEATGRFWQPPWDVGKTCPGSGQVSPCAGSPLRWL